MDISAVYLKDVLRMYRNYKALGDGAIAQVHSDADLLTLIDPDANSIAVIVKHVAGNLRSRFRDFLTADGEKPDRNRDGEFDVSETVSRHEVMAWWNEGWAVAMEALESLTPEDLGRTIHIRGDVDVTITPALVHDAVAPAWTWWNDFLPEVDVWMIEAGMKAILIAEDDDEIEVKEHAAQAPASGPPAPRAAAAPAERTLMLGWNRRAPMIALELSRYVAPGSLLTIAADTPELAQEFEGLVLAGDNLAVEMKRIDTSRRGEIEALDPTGCDHILVLGRHMIAVAEHEDMVAAGRHPHARHPAAPAPDRRRCGQADQRRQRDDRRAQPRACRGRPDRRFRGQQQAGQPDARPSLGKRASRGDFQGPAR